MSSKKIDLYLSELISRIYTEDVTKRNDIEFLFELMLEQTDKYFPKQKLSKTRIFRKKADIS